MSVGEDVGNIGWVVVNESAEPTDFTIEAADDVLGSQTTRNGSTRWLRIRDIDGGNVQNRFYSPTILGDDVKGYIWTYYVNLETTPPGGASVKPKLTIQHVDTMTGFANAWGIEFTDAGANMIVLGIGGSAASTPLYSLTSPTAVGNWVKIELQVNLQSNVVSARVNDGMPVSLTINPISTINRDVFRLCYRGEGTGNVQTMLLDDVSLAVIPGAVPAVSEWGLIVLGLLVLSAGTVMLLRGRRVVQA